ncbi:MAG TPA: hypothetical protein VMW87_10195 [Spirochaetia bacterium]|nr:hypothetical protein [Spirochaetia bacterium]
MPTTNGISNGELILVCGVLFAVIAYLVISRRIESRRIEQKFSHADIVATSFGVGYFGLSSEPGGPARSSGALVLLKDGVYYRARLRRRELHIPAESLRGIDIVESHKGKPLYQKAIAIRFSDVDANEVTAVFRIPMPDRWLRVMRETILKRPIAVRDQTAESSE